eukprot:TRINITY_DN63013_c0_g1_i1.p1 TRINITY_DN63013_c0_g1~~TRINITY_DN63013_c0_g1_i1.p1  ORF type:complete len:662 (-),score=161.72 TRINITY_DN63013_c0_g1_i1:61-1911(-)
MASRRRHPRHLQLLAGAACLGAAVVNWPLSFSSPGSSQAAFTSSAALGLGARTHTLTVGQQLGPGRSPAAAVILQAKGFATEAAPVAAKEVAEPAGGWPSISVLVLNPESKLARPEALKQLAEQDYPLDQIKEVVVSDASMLSALAPEVLQSLLRDFKSSNDLVLNVGQEIAACSGDMVVLWSDAQISAPHRLREQVAHAVATSAVTLLQPTWFYDPMTQGFQRINDWPSQMMEEMSNLGISENLVKADVLTLCGDRATLAEACADVHADASPEVEFKEVLQKLPQAQLMEDLNWASVRTPPALARYEAATPNKALVQLAEAAWPKGAVMAGASSSQVSLSAIVKMVDDKQLGPVDAIGAYLTDEELDVITDRDLQKVRKSMEQSLLRGGPESVADAVAAISSWEGLVIGKGDVKLARKFPIFYQAFGAVRSYCAENADFMDMRQLGQISESLVLLAKRMWASDEKVNQAMTTVLTKELWQESGGQLTEEKFSTADVVGTLGLRPTMQAFAYAALDLPDSLLTADSLAALAWALSESEVENTALSRKVAKGIISRIEKVQPPDIGRLFIAMHERLWFKDDDVVEYLTKSLLSRIQDLKAEDPGIAKMLAEAQAEAR